MTVQSTLLRSKHDISLVKAQDEKIYNNILINQIASKIGLKFNLKNERDIVPQGLFSLYNDKHAEDLLSILKDKLPDGENVNEFLVKANDLLDSTDPSLFSDIKKAADTLRDMKETAKQVVSASKTTLKLIAGGLMLFLIIRFSLKPNYKTAASILLLGVAIWYTCPELDSFDCVKTIMGEKWMLLISCFMGSNDNNDSVEKEIEMIIPQSSCESTTVYDVLIMGFLAYTGVKTKGSLSDLSKDGSFRTFSDLLRMRSSIPEFLDSLLGYVKKLYNNYMSDFLRTSKWDVNNFEDPQLCDFERDVLELREKLANGKFAKSIDNFAKVKAMHEKSKDLYKSIPTDRNNSSVRTLFMKNVDALGKIRLEFESSNVHLNGFRVEPVGILIRGGPGTHKSTLMSHIASACAASVLQDEDYVDYLRCPQNFEHNRQHETIYMDGYTPQTITIMIDDLGQTKDVAGNPDTEWMNVIRFINSFEAMGHVAKMEQKGVLRIRPKFVMATTNMIRLSSQSINCIDAVTRRFPVSIVCVPRPDLCSDDSEGIFGQKFNYSLLPKKINSKGVVIADLKPDHFRFYECDARGDITSGLRTFDDIMEDIINHHRTRVAWHEAHVKNFNEISNLYRQKYFKQYFESQSTRPYDYDTDSVEGTFSDCLSVEVDDIIETSEHSRDDTHLNDEKEPTPFAEYVKYRRSAKFETMQAQVDWYYQKLRENEDVNQHQHKKIQYSAFIDHEFNDQDDIFCSITQLKHLAAVKMDLLSKYFTPSERDIIDNQDYYKQKEFSLFDNTDELDVFLKWRKDWSVLYRTIPRNYFNVLFSVPHRWNHFDTESIIRILYRNNAKLLQHFLITNIMPPNQDKIDLPNWAEQYCTGTISVFTTIKTSFNLFMVNTIGWTYEALESICGYGEGINSNIYKFVNETFGSTATTLLYASLFIYGAVGLGNTANSLLTYVTGSKTDDKKVCVDDNGETFNSQSSFYDAVKSSKTKHKTVAQMRNTVKGVPEVQPQGIDIAGFDVMDSITLKNLTKFYVYKDDEDNDPKFMGYAILLKKNKVLVPTHFYERLFRGFEAQPERGDYLIRLCPNTEDENVIWAGTCKVSEFLKNGHDEGLEETHMMIVNMPTKDCRNIIKSFFVTDAIASNLAKTFDITVCFPHRKLLNTSGAYKSVVPITDGDIKYNVTKGIRYFADTFNGDCGAPIYIRNAKLQAHRIIGAHIAGSSTSGSDYAFSSLLTQEMIEKCMLQFKDDNHNVKTELPSDCVPFDLQSDAPFMADRFSILAKAPKHHSPYGFTSIKKSRLQKPIGPIASNFGLAPLMPRDGKDPYKTSLATYCSNEVVVDKALLKFCSRDLQSYLFSSYEIKKTDILSLEEALWGDENIDFSDSIRSSSSAGYPMKYETYNRKKVLFDSKNKRDTTNPAYADTLVAVSEIIEKARKGIRMLHLFTDNLKDQRMKMAKVRAYLGRLFSGGPFDYLVVCRMYFGRFMQHIHNHSMENSMVTSINPFSDQWDVLANKLKSFSTDEDPMVLDGDFSHYDGSFLTDFAEEILVIINNYYNDDNSLIRKILWMEITNSRHISGNVIYEWFGSLPSGHLLTLIVNCLNNLLIHRYVFYQTFPRTYKFHKEVVIEVTGDDVIMAVSQRCQKDFNGLTIAKLMAGIGYTYTSATKEDEVVPFKPLSQAQFLKRSFRFEPLIGKYVGPLDMKTVVEIPLWTKKHDSLAITISNMEEFMDELSLHDDDTWDNVGVPYKYAFSTLFPEYYDTSSINQDRFERLSCKLDITAHPFINYSSSGKNPKM